MHKKSGFIYIYTYKELLETFYTQCSSVIMHCVMHYMHAYVNIYVIQQYILHIYNTIALNQSRAGCLFVSFYVPYIYKVTQQKHLSSVYK